MLGDRYGRFWLLCLSGLFIIVAALILNGPLSTLTLTLSVVLYFFAWNCAVAYQLLIVSAVDTTGRGVAITQAFAFLGSAAGAGVAGLMVTPSDYRPVVWLVVSAVSVSTGLFSLVTDAGAARATADASDGQSVY